MAHWRALARLQTNARRQIDFGSTAEIHLDVTSHSKRSNRERARRKFTESILCAVLWEDFSATGMAD
jgi:hypothetical protein